MPPRATTSEFDTEMMDVALMMAGRGLGATAPNPSVGAVIADEATGEVIARGTTAHGGRPHAEVVAIGRAGDAARGKTIYVTLEPCAHQGLTGPCAEAIIAAGLKRAVVAIEDPDPRVAGRGLDRLRAAGIEVVRGVRAAEARWLTLGHIVRITERRPLTTLKFALDAQGEIARGTGSAPVWVSGKLSRTHAMMLRAEFDAILIGNATARDDDPKLTCRLPGLLDRSPIRVVLARKLDIGLDSKLVRSAAETPLWLMTSAPADAPARAALAAKHLTIIDVAEIDNQLWLPAVMEALVARGVTRLVVEGGPTVWRAFAKAAFFDEVVLYMAGRGDESRARAALRRYLGDLQLTLSERRTFEPDTMWRFRRALPQEGI
jgi:diaminohydroxyphosphoribosylaminopyrimidine deaminase/5-amino-6-(5-phosphoribosylamino)uracil reductase